jgi:hypothetical protein
MSLGVHSGAGVRHRLLNLELLLFLIAIATKRFYSPDSQSRIQ